MVAAALARVRPRPEMTTGAASLGGFRRDVNLVFGDQAGRDRRMPG
jgi:hypothetical protein